MVVEGELLCWVGYGELLCGVCIVVVFDFKVVLCVVVDFMVMGWYVVWLDGFEKVMGVVKYMVDLCLFGMLYVWILWLLVYGVLLFDFDLMFV